MAAARDGTKLRVLCLHGFLQSATVFRSRTGSLRRLLKPYAELEYVTAPIDVDPTEIAGFADVGEDVETKSWWRPNRDRTQYTDLEVTLALLQTTVAEQGPFDGLLGFSQGAALVGMLCHMRARGDLPWLQIRFAVMIAGFKALDPTYLACYSNVPLTLPTLHIYGDGDNHVVPARSKALAETFADPAIYVHAGGHFVPADGKSKPAYVDFFTAMSNKAAPA